MSFALPIVFFLAAATVNVEEKTMLYQVEELSYLYSPLVAKAPPPSLNPKADEALSIASNLLSIDLSKIDPGEQTVLGALGNAVFWDALQEMGIDGVELKGLKGTNNAPTQIGIDSSFGTFTEYEKLCSLAAEREISFIGSILSQATGRGPDFALALKNAAPFKGIYHLIEIDPQDWSILPSVQNGEFSTNVPWLTLQTLHKMGYVPENFDPYTKQSSWNTTPPILGIDQKMRRWIYLQDGAGNPCLEWLSPSFSSERLAAGDLLFSLYGLNNRFIQLGSALPLNAKESLSLFARKLGAFTLSVEKGGVASLNTSRADLKFDHLTPIGALHALITKDAEALKLTYRLFQSEKVLLKSLIHAMEPFGRAPCDWAEFLERPNKTYRYFETDLTGKALRERLLKEDLAQIHSPDSASLSTWSGTCQAILGKKMIQEKQDELLKIQLLLAKFFAWQPGAFLISFEDLVGAIPNFDSISISKKENSTLYSPLPLQLKNPNTLASNLKLILRARNDYSIEKAALFDVPTASKPSTLLLRYRLPISNQLVLLAVNFGAQPVQETFDGQEYRKTSAINLMTRLNEEKFFESSKFSLKLEPLDAKLILFQPKHF